MKTILRIVVIMGLSCAAAVASFSSPRVGVVVDKVAEAIDTRLGKLDIAEKILAQRLEKMEAAEQNLRKGKIGQQVRAEALQKSIMDEEEKIGDIDKALRILHGSIAAKTDAEFNGVTYTLEQQKELAGQLLRRRETAIGAVAGKQKLMDLLNRNLTTLESQHQESMLTIAKCKDLLSEARAKREVLTALEKSSRLIGDVDTSFAENMADFKREIEEFSEQVETALRVEDVNLETARSAGGSTDEVENILKSTQSSADILSEIGRILGI